MDFNAFPIAAYAAFAPALASPSSSSSSGGGRDFRMTAIDFLEIADLESPAGSGGSPTCSESDELADELKFALEIVAEWSSDSNSNVNVPYVPKRKRTPLPSASPSPSQLQHTKAEIRLERNRRLAAESRARKKKYVASLESQLRALQARVASLTAENEELRQTPKRQRINSTGSTPLFLAAFLFTFFVNPAFGGSGGTLLHTVGSSASAAAHEWSAAHDFSDFSDFSSRDEASVFDTASAAGSIFTAASAAPASFAVAKGGSECRAGGASKSGDSARSAAAATTTAGAPRFARFGRSGSHE